MITHDQSTEYDLYFKKVERIIQYLRMRRDKVYNNKLLRIYKDEIDAICRLTGYYPIDVTYTSPYKPIRDLVENYVITTDEFINAVWTWLQLGKPLDFHEFYTELHGDVAMQLFSEDSQPMP